VLVNIRKLLAEPLIAIYVLLASTTMILPTHLYMTKKPIVSFAVLVNILLLKQTAVFFVSRARTTMILLVQWQANTTKNQIVQCATPVHIRLLLGEQTNAIPALVANSLLILIPQVNMTKNLIVKFVVLGNTLLPIKAAV
jgi:hypothetical protein